MNIKTTVLIPTSVIVSEYHKGHEFAQFFPVLGLGPLHDTEMINRIKKKVLKHTSATQHYVNFLRVCCYLCIVSCESLDNSTSRSSKNTKKSSYIKKKLKTSCTLVMYLPSPVKYITNFKIVFLSTACSLVPGCIAELLIPYSTSRPLRSADQSLLCIPPTQLKSKSAFSHCWSLILE